MPTNVASAKNTNTINVKVVVGDVAKKKKPRRKAAPSANDESPPAPAPAPSVTYNNYTEHRGGPSRRPYDEVDSSVVMEQEQALSGLISNFATFQQDRINLLTRLQQEMQDIISTTEGTDQTMPPPAAPDVPEHGAQPQEPHRAEAFAAPPTQEIETQTPSALPASPSGGRARRSLRNAMLNEGVIRPDQNVTPYRREAYLHWVNAGRPPGDIPNFTSQGVNE